MKITDEATLQILELFPSSFDIQVQNRMNLKREVDEFDTDDVI